ncbi:DnaA ATPase domain-containing protein [Mesomycoplasma neurolyticum]|uniref:Primosomal protein DnaI n=1 Tax=Mesomycoplasma neurolyticum TaxID=2120 RepID=A0A449A643_9BACT|nr:DnaA/Hda family protein [Mesomycoplasma neurolyticum]VEU59708.1 Primosomal protein DnaI [Mesomycoplasma neurolyticum]
MKNNDLNLFLGQSEFNIDEEKQNLIKKIYQNEKIKKIIIDENITLLEIQNNIATFIQMLNPNSNYFITLKRDENKKLKKVYFLSNEFKKQSYKNRFWLTEITDINYQNTKEKLLKQKYNVSVVELLSDKNAYRVPFYLCGQSGKGKTSSLEAIAIERARENNETIAFLNLPDLYAYVFDLFNNKTTTIQSISDKIKEVDVLFLDDIGSETPNFWFLNTFLFPILNYRNKLKKPTYFSSNFPQDELLNVYKSPKIDANFIKRLITRIKGLVHDELFTE